MHLRSYTLDGKALCMQQWMALPTWMQLWMEQHMHRMDNHSSTALNTTHAEFGLDSLHLVFTSVHATHIGNLSQSSLLSPLHFTFALAFAWRLAMAPALLHPCWHPHSWQRPPPGPKWHRVGMPLHRRLGMPLCKWLGMELYMRLGKWLGTQLYNWWLGKRLGMQWFANTHQITNPCRKLCWLSI